MAPVARASRATACTVSRAASGEPVAWRARARYASGTPGPTCGPDEPGCRREATLELGPRLGRVACLVPGNAEQPVHHEPGGGSCPAAGNRSIPRSSRASDSASDLEPTVTSASPSTVAAAAAVIDWPVRRAEASAGRRVSMAATYSPRESRVVPSARRVSGRTGASAPSSSRLAPAGSSAPRSLGRMGRAPPGGRTAASRLSPRRLRESGGGRRTPWRQRPGGSGTTPAL